MSEQQITFAEMLERGVAAFEHAGLCYGHGTDNPQDEALLLMLHALARDWDDSVDPGEILAPAMVARIDALFERRISERLPAAYLTGEAWLHGLRFKVDQRVLVPRSPIAEVIDHACQPWLGSTVPRRILDLCCGSGCLGILCAYAFPDAEIVLADISADALAVANENIALHGLQHRVRSVRSDLFADIDSAPFDVIVCNPPYVDASDLDTMPAEFRHEPELGLASGEDGLLHARRILGEAALYLEDAGLLVLEVGNSWPALEAAYPDTAFMWVDLEQGGHGVLAMRREELPQQ